MARVLDLDTEIVGRHAELERLRGFLEPGSPHGALVLAGGPGIGKTRCWEAGIDAARAAGFRVLVARPAAAEIRLSFVSLADLLDDVDLDELAELAPAQRRTLAVALMREASDGAEPEPPAVAVAFLGALRALALQEPVVVAVDDLQWLDPDSAHVLVYAARRLIGAPVRFLLASRPRGFAALAHALRPTGYARIDLPPLSLPSMRRLLATRLGISPPRRLLQRIADASRGNPLFTVELGRMLAERDLPEIGDELALPDALEELVGARVDRLAPPVRRLVLAVALGGELRTVQLAALAAGQEVVDEAVEAGVLVVERDRVRLEHPLLGAAARRRSRARDRRELHADLADVIVDEQRRARHLALAAARPDSELATRVTSAARAAGTRGAAQDAAELARHALRLTPPDAPERVDRLLALAEALQVAGEDRALTELLLPEIERMPHGTPRARAHVLIAGSGLADPDRHLALALADSDGDADLRTTALALMAVHRAVAWIAPVHDTEGAAIAAVGASEDAGPSAQALALFALAWARAMRGGGIADLHDRYDRLPLASPELFFSLDRVAALRHMWRGEVEPARALLITLQWSAEERGEGWSASAMQLHLCELTARTGDWPVVARMLADWTHPYGEDHISAPMGDRVAALVAAGQGRRDEAERLAERAIAGALAAGIRWDELEARRALGLAALLGQDPALAAERLQVVWDYTERAGIGDPGIFPVAPDLVEALAATGRREQAQAVARRLAEATDHPWAAVAATRCEGILKLDQDALDAAQAGYHRLGLHFDAARTLLVSAATARRNRRRADARQRLEQAAEAFAALGSPGWAERARSELAPAADGKRRKPGELTSTERRVAELAVAGRSNLEIAGALGASVHTVEVHLSRVYAKLGVRSRTQLARRKLP